MCSSACKSDEAAACGNSARYMLGNKPLKVTRPLTCLGMGCGRYDSYQRRIVFYSDLQYLGRA